MPQLTLTDFVGLVTSPGLLSRNQASLVEATNVVINSPGLIQQRRPHVRQALNVPGVVPSLAYTNLENGYVYAYNSAPSGYPGQTVSQYVNAAGNMVFPTGSPGVNKSTDYGFGMGRIKAFAQNGAMYFNSPSRQTATATYRMQNPVVRMESVASTTARYAGAPMGMAPDTYNMSAAVYSVLFNGTTNWLPVDCAVAYRVTWHRRFGTNRMELGGAPTGRLVVRNISGTSGWAAATARSVQLRIPIPKELWSTANLTDTTQWFCRLWRTLTPPANEEPNDEMTLVAEVSITAGDIAAGYVLYQDNTPDSYLNKKPTLHTNTQAIAATDVNGAAGEQQQGILNSDDPPPFATHCAYWANRAWYANFGEIPSNLVTLLVVGGASGLAATHQIVIAGLTLTAVAGAPGANQFTVVTGLSSLELNIEATARNIVEAFNRNTTSTARAYYYSTSLATPGVIYIVGASFPSFALGATPPPTTAFQWDSSASALFFKNKVRFSKKFFPDRCAPLNTLQVGPDENEILAMRPLRDKLFFFTTKGIYVLTGDDWSNFGVYEFDLTYKLAAPGLVAECEDRLLAWFREGIAEITDGGVQIISGPIEDYIRNYANTYAYGMMFDLGFAVAYRMRHQVLFFHPAKAKDTRCTTCDRWLVWDTRTRAWTLGEFDPSKGYTQGGFNWYEGKSCAAVPVNPADPDLIVSWGVNGSGNCYQFIEAETGGTETNSDGTTWSPLATVRFQFQIPDASEAMHWQQTLVHLPSDNGLGGSVGPSADNYTAPSSFTVTHRALGLSGAVAGAAQSVTVFSNALLRVEPPANARRGQKMQLLLNWTPAATGAFGIVGVTQTFRPGSANPKGQP